MAEFTGNFFNEVIVLRCCRDWPCHISHAYAYSGRCGLCKEIPVVVEEIFPEEKYFRNIPQTQGLP